MSEFNIEVQGGSSVRLPTAGKYCEKDIIVTASGGGGTEEIGSFYSNFDSNGYPTKLMIKGLKTIPAQYLRPYDANNAISSRVYEIDLGVAETIGQSAFRNCFGTRNENVRVIRIPATVKTIEIYAFAEPRTPHIYFEGTPESIDANAFTTTRETNIYVPWAEGAVANAPWGATKATIHYNYVEGENTNADS